MLRNCIRQTNRANYPIENTIKYYKLAIFIPLTI